MAGTTTTPTPIDEASRKRVGHWNFVHLTGNKAKMQNVILPPLLGRVGPSLVQVLQPNRLRFSRLEAILEPFNSDNSEGESSAMESFDKEQGYPVGLAIFLRTDTPDYEEEAIPFHNLEEMVSLCSQSNANLVLDKVIVYAMQDGEPCALTLGFVSASKGQRPTGIRLVKS